MTNLYIDFDGVILNTIEISYNEMKKLKIMDNPIKIMEYYRNLDWKKFLNICKPINDSINCIQKIIDSNIFNVNILSHVNSLEEAIAKIEYIRRYFKDITFIPVPKQISKTKMVHTNDAYLIDDFKGNLVEWEKAGGIGIRFNTDMEANGFTVIDRLDSIIDIVSE